MTKVQIFDHWQAHYLSIPFKWYELFWWKNYSHRDEGGLN